MIIATAKIAPCSPDDGVSAVRNGISVVGDDRSWLETHAPRAFLAFTADSPPPVVDRHDGRQIGHVSALAAGRQWWVADLVLEDDARPLARVGARVSIDARSLRRDDNPIAGTRRHRVVKLDALAFVGPGQIAGYPGAVITHVREVKRRANTSPVARRASAAAGEYQLKPGETWL